MPTLEPAEVREFLTQVEDDCRPRARFYSLIFLAATIATFGLLANSAAVIIGAMLVAPLMSAIIGVAVGIVLNRRALLRRATFSLVTGAVLALVTGMALSLLSPMTDPGSEILGRVRPTLYDLWVAVAAGLAGAYSLLRARSSAALPGVAIATALVPPLVTAGIEFRLLELGGALGALLLFLSNMVAITCAGMAVFMFYGLHRHAKYEADYRASAVYSRWGASFLAVGLLLAHSLHQVVTEARTDHDVQEVLKSQVKMVPGASVDRYELTPDGKTLKVLAVVATPASIGPPLVASTERLLAARLRRPVRLVVRSVLTKDADAQDYLQAERPAAPTRGPLVIVEELLREQAQALPEAELIDYSVRREGGGYRVTAQYRTGAPVDNLLIRGIRNLLADALAAPVELHLEVLPQAGSEPPASAPAPPAELVSPPEPAANTSGNHPGP